MRALSIRELITLKVFYSRFNFRENCDKFLSYFSEYDF